MRISFAPSPNGTSNFRALGDNMSGVVCRIWASEECPRHPGEVFDAQIRYANYGANSDEWVVQPWDREADQRTGDERVVRIERVHVY